MLTIMKVFKKWKFCKKQEVPVPAYFTYLDSILIFIKDKALNNKISIFELYKGITGLDYDINVHEKKILVLDEPLRSIEEGIPFDGTVYSHQQKFIEALNFLISEKLIRYNENTSEVGLSSAGLIKIHTSNFANDYTVKSSEVKEMQESLRYLRNQNKMLWILLIASIGGAISQFLDFIFNC